MAQGGRIPKPTPLKILHGDRKDRINTNEPVPASLEVKCPSWLPSAGKTIWKSLAPDLIRTEVLTHWDVDQFARYCWLSAKSRELMKIVEDEGLIVNGDRGVRVKHPAMQLIKDTHAQMSRYAAKFGLTPSDRAQLSFKPGDDDDAGDYFT